MDSRKNIFAWLLLAVCTLALLFMLFKSWQRTKEIDGTLQQNPINHDNKK